MGKQWKQWQIFCGGSKITADGDCSHEIKSFSSKLAPWKKSYHQSRQLIKKQRHYFANKGPSSQGYGFCSSHVWMWDLDCEEGWAWKNWCFWTVVLEKTLESPWDCKEIQPARSEVSKKECQVRESRQIVSGQTRDLKSERRPSRNLQTKMDLNGWI